MTEKVLFSRIKGCSKIQREYVEVNFFKKIAYQNHIAGT